jgi:hypothetical protein
VRNSGEADKVKEDEALKDWEELRRE